MTPEDKKTVPATGLPTPQSKVKAALDAYDPMRGVNKALGPSELTGFIEDRARMRGEETNRRIGEAQGFFETAGAVSRYVPDALTTVGEGLGLAALDMGSGVVGAGKGFVKGFSGSPTPTNQPAQTPAVPPVAPTAPVTTTTNPATKLQSGTGYGNDKEMYSNGITVEGYNANGKANSFSGKNIAELSDRDSNFTVMDSSGLRATPYYKQAVAELAGQGLPQVAPQNQIITIGENGGFGFDKPDPAKQRIQAIDMAAKDMAAKAGISAPTPGMIKAATAMYQSYDDLTNANTVASTSRANKQDDVMLGREGLMSEEGRAQAKAITDMLLRQDANANALQVAGLGNIGKVEAARIGQESKGIPKPMVTMNAQGQPDVFVPVMNSETGGYEFVLQSEMNKRRMQAQEQKQ